MEDNNGRLSQQSNPPCRTSQTNCKSSNNPSQSDLRVCNNGILNLEKSLTKGTSPTNRTARQDRDANVQHSTPNTFSQPARTARQYRNQSRQTSSPSPSPPDRIDCEDREENVKHSTPNTSSEP